MVMIIKICDHDAAIRILLPVKNVDSFFDQFKADTLMAGSVIAIVFPGKLPPYAIVCYSVYDVFIFEFCRQVQAQRFGLALG